MQTETALHVEIYMIIWAVWCPRDPMLAVFKFQQPIDKNYRGLNIPADRYNFAVDSAIYYHPLVAFRMLINT